MHKAFINDKPLIFEDVYTKINVVDENILILSEAEFVLKEAIEKLNTNNISGIVYLCARPDQAWSEFTGRYILMEAAGGIVKNKNDEILVIYRRKRWDLPKGKLEYNESPEDAAIREVKEECGIKNLVLEKFLLKTFHTYTEKEKFILKKTHWFMMTTSDNEELIPQLEEDIEEAKWMSKEKIYKKVLPMTYASIKEVLQTYFKEK